MNITRIGEAQPYAAPAHFDVRTLRLAGQGLGDPRAFTVGLTHLLPAGGAEDAAAPLERVYVVLSGEVTVRMQGVDYVLHPLDSIYIDRDEKRSLRNDTKLPASMLVVIENERSAR